MLLVPPYRRAITLEHSGTLADQAAVWRCSVAFRHLGWPGLGSGSLFARASLLLGASGLRPSVVTLALLRPGVVTLALICVLLLRQRWGSTGVPGFTWPEFPFGSSAALGARPRAFGRTLEFPALATLG